MNNADPVFEVEPTAAIVLRALCRAAVSSVVPLHWAPYAGEVGSIQGLGPLIARPPSVGACACPAAGKAQRHATKHELAMFRFRVIATPCRARCVPCLRALRLWKREKDIKLS
jgi:hypothetical protein